jgi:hypothetical protein
MTHWVFHISMIFIWEHLLHEIGQKDAKFSGNFALAGNVKPLWVTAHDNWVKAGFIVRASGQLFPWCFCFVLWLLQCWTWQMLEPLWTVSGGTLIAQSGYQPSQSKIIFGSHQCYWFDPTTITLCEVSKWHFHLYAEEKWWAVIWRKNWNLETLVGATKDVPKPAPVPVLGNMAIFREYLQRNLVRSWKQNRPFVPPRDWLPSWHGLPISQHFCKAAELLFRLDPLQVLFWPVDMASSVP